MSLLSRLLGYASKEEAVGVRLNDSQAWIVPAAPDAATVLRSLPALFPSQAFMYFEGTTERPFADWLGAHAVPGPMKIA